MYYPIKLSQFAGLKKDHSVYLVALKNAATSLLDPVNFWNAMFDYMPHCIGFELVQHIDLEWQ